MTVFVAVINAIAAVVISLSVVYFFVEMLSGLHEVRKNRSSLGAQSRSTYGRPYLGDPETYDVYVLIPCLNEEEVIGATVKSLAGGARVTTIVIDDGSDDRTAAIAREEGGANALVLQRRAPDARKGKGEALNAGYALVQELVAQASTPSREVLILVMDADGRLSDGAFREVLPLFDNPRVGGVQLAVRIRNRRKNFLTWFQDFQFWSMSAVTQFGRMKTGTVSLGGNGQFTRLSALEELPGSPWSASLTEDLDLAITLAINGWDLHTTPAASVDQQGVESLKRLFVQRRRWYQGHMSAGRRLPLIWGNEKLSNTKALELTAYLLVPWLFDLPWSILWHWTLFMFVTRTSSVFSFITDPLSLLIGGAIWYILTFAPALFTTAVYLRRDLEVSLIRALVLGHSFIIMNYLSFFCAWGALFRIIRGKTGWDKTVRVSETTTHPAQPPAIDVNSR